MHNPHRRTTPDTAAPLAETEAADLAAMPFLSDADREAIANLPAIPDRRRRCVSFLRSFAEGKKYREASKLADVQPWEISWMRKNCPAYREAHELLITARHEHAVSLVEETLEQMATGCFKTEEGYLPPDTRAASILLPAYSPRYRNGGGAAQQVQINVTI